MDVLVKATVLYPEMFGTVVDMPTPRVYVIQTRGHGYITVHDDEIAEFFSN